MTSPPLVLSLFPGIGLLDMAFEEAGFCVVRGPDLLWGGDVRKFHPPSGKFDGVIGGPPCKCFSPLANIVRAVHGEDSVAPNMIPEFERVIREAQPVWFVMENVTNAPPPRVRDYAIKCETIRYNWVGGETNRLRKFSFGHSAGWRINIDTLALHIPDPKPTVTTNSGGRRKEIAYDDRGRVRGKQGHADNARLKWRCIQEMAAEQSIPLEFVGALQEHGAFTAKALRTGLGNGVPLPMGRAVAAAVKRALGLEQLEAAE